MDGLCAASRFRAYRRPIANYQTGLWEHTSPLVGCSLTVSSPAAPGTLTGYGLATVVPGVPGHHDVLSPSPPS